MKKRSITDRKNLFKKTNRVVVKIGTNIITNKGEPDENKIKRIVKEISLLIKRGKEVIVVTSGSIGCGRALLMPKGTSPQTIPMKQACASVGQPILMEHYKTYFKEFGLNIGQILLTDGVLDRPAAYKNARNTILTLISKKCVPIVNENDTIAIDEIKFGDNDTLASAVSLVVGADICILLSDINGFYLNYNDIEKREKLDFVHEITDSIISEAGDKNSSFSTGGMRTKILAADRLMKAGISMAIINGNQKDELTSLFNGNEVGTIFLATKKSLSSVRRWLSHQAKPCGKIIVDEGAYNALIKRGKSLLPSGIIDVTGDFESGSVVEIAFNDNDFAKGISWYSSKDIKLIKGKNTSKIEKILGYKEYDEVIHRDNLLII